MVSLHLEDMYLQWLTCAWLSSGCCITRSNIVQVLGTEQFLQWSHRCHLRLQAYLNRCHTMVPPHLSGESHT